MFFLGDVSVFNVCEILVNYVLLRFNTLTFLCDKQLNKKYIYKSVCTLKFVNK